LRITFQEDNTLKTELVTYPDGRLEVHIAAEYLGRAAKTLAQWRSKGIGPTFIKPGGRVFYFKEDLDTWLNRSGRCQSTQQARFLQQKHQQIQDNNALHTEVVL
jgi:predicted site-specific integrase-resolvase